MGEDHVHEPPPKAGWAGGTPGVAILSCMLRFPWKAGNNLWYLEVSGFQLCCRLAALTSNRPHGQPRCPHSTPHWRRGLAHDSWCPAGHDNSAENSEAY